MKLTEQQLKDLREAYRLISEVQVAMYLDEDHRGCKDGEWKPLFSVRSALGFEQARLTRMANE